MNKSLFLLVESLIKTLVRIYKVFYDLILDKSESQLMSFYFGVLIRIIDLTFKINDLSRFKPDFMSKNFIHYIFQNSL